jgi:hypothetical protein
MCGYCTVVTFNTLASLKFSPYLDPPYCIHTHTSMHGTTLSKSGPVSSLCILSLLWLIH